MLAPQRELYLVLISVLLIETLTGCSGFHSLSNHSTATAESTYDNNLLSEVHSRVARSDNNHSETNMQTSLEDFLANQSITVDKVYSTKAPSTRKYVVVFDVDNTLCSRINYAKKVKETMRRFPECPVIRFEHEVHSNPFKHSSTNEVWAFNFLPYLQILFEYLLDQGVRIVFFSAAIKERNDEVLPELLKFYWGDEKYESFRSKGQFMTFSKNDLITRRGYDPTTATSCGEYVKDLGRIIRDGETLSDVILVDDDYCYATRDQKPLILVHDLYLCNEALNNIYYMLGLFKTYFDNIQYRKLPLREGIDKIFSENQVEDKRYLRSEHSFTIRMINNGLLEVQKVVPKARLYSPAERLFRWQ